MAGERAVIDLQPLFPPFAFNAPVLKPRFMITAMNCGWTVDGVSSGP